MVYITGDIHGKVDRIISFAEKMNLSENDIIIILGDAGLNFYGDSRDRLAKKFLNRLGITIFCIHGNHENRPHHIPGYHLKDWHGGMVWVEDEYPHLLFAKDGDIYEIDGNRFLVIGGAYSVDKQYRLLLGFGWWEDEQPSPDIKAYVEEQVAKHPLDYILTHTCPFKYEPIEVFLSNVDQSTVDNSTELWLDSIEERVNYKAWFCGHWHTDKRIDKMHFLFNSWESIGD